jgi:hypothetical protein
MYARSVFIRFFKVGYHVFMRLNFHLSYNFIVGYCFLKAAVSNAFFVFV